MNAERFIEGLEWLEERSKPIFVAVALLLYAISLFQLMQETNPFDEPDAFLVEALIRLSVPFGVILLQELFELLTSISQSTLNSARRQFEIVVLVIVRSFFKNFAKVNAKVEAGLVAEPVTEAVVKVLAIIIIASLIITFIQLSKHQTLQSYAEEAHSLNIVKQVIVLLLAGFVLIDLLVVKGSFEELEFISLIFTGLIVIDAIFLIIAILQDSEFDSLVFESSLVISLIFARFPLFTSNTLAYTLSVIGVAFATGSLYLLHRSRLLSETPD